MRTLMRGAILGISILALSGVVTGAMAQRGVWRNDDSRPSRAERIAEFLELNEKQMDQLKELREERWEQMAEMRKELMRVEHEIRGEMLEDNPDVSAIKKLLAKKGQIRTDMEVARFEHRLAMRDILTEEQFDKLMMRRGGFGRGGFGRQGRGFGRGGMGPGRGHGRGPGCGLGCGLGSGGPMMGLGQEFPDEDCLGLGPGPYLWCEK